MNTIQEFCDSLDPDSNNEVEFDDERAAQMEAVGMRTFGHRKLSEWYLHARLSFALEEHAADMTRALLR